MRIGSLRGDFNGIGMLGNVRLRCRPKGVCNLINRGKTKGAALFGYVVKVCSCAKDVAGDGALGANCLSTSGFFCSRVANLRRLRFYVGTGNLPIGAPAVRRLGRVFRLPLSECTTRCSAKVGGGLKFVTLLLRSGSMFVLSRPFGKISLGKYVLVGELVQRLGTGRGAIVVSSRLVTSLERVYSVVRCLGRKNVCGRCRRRAARRVRRSVLYGAGGVRPASCFRWRATLSLPRGCAFSSVPVLFRR